MCARQPSRRSAAWPSVTSGRSTGSWRRLPAGRRRGHSRDPARHAGAAGRPAIAAAPRAPERRRSVLRRPAAVALSVARRTSRPGDDHGPLSQRPSSRARDASHGASGEALRCALRLLDDPNPLVRAHASRTASTIAPLTAASFLVPLLADRSWWVREAAREGLVAAGRDVDGAVAPALASDDQALRWGPHSSCRTSGSSTSWFG